MNNITRFGSIFIVVGLIMLLLSNIQNDPIDILMGYGKTGCRDSLYVLHKKHNFTELVTGTKEQEIEPINIGLGTLTFWLDSDNVQQPGIFFKDKIDRFSISEDLKHLYVGNKFKIPLNPGLHHYVISITPKKAVVYVDGSQIKSLKEHLLTVPPQNIKLRLSNLRVSPFVLNSTDISKYFKVEKKLVL